MFNTKSRHCNEALRETLGLSSQSWKGKDEYTAAHSSVQRCTYAQKKNDVCSFKLIAHMIKAIKQSNL